MPEVAVKIPHVEAVEADYNEIRPVVHTHFPSAIQKRHQLRCIRPFTQSFIDAQ